MESYYFYDFLSDTPEHWGNGGREQAAAFSYKPQAADGSESDTDLNDLLKAELRALATPDPTLHGTLPLDRLARTGLSRQLVKKDDDKLNTAVARLTAMCGNEKFLSDTRVEVAARRDGLVGMMITGRAKAYLTEAESHKKEDWLSNIAMYCVWMLRQFSGLPGNSAFDLQADGDKTIVVPAAMPLPVRVSSWKIGTAPRTAKKMVEENCVKTADVFCHMDGPTGVEPKKEQISKALLQRQGGLIRRATNALPEVIKGGARLSPGDGYSYLLERRIQAMWIPVTMPALIFFLITLFAGQFWLRLFGFNGWSALLQPQIDRISEADPDSGAWIPLSTTDITLLSLALFAIALLSIVHVLALRRAIVAPKPSWLRRPGTFALIVWLQPVAFIGLAILLSLPSDLIAPANTVKRSLDTVHFSSFLKQLKGVLPFLSMAIALAGHRILLDTIGAEGGPRHAVRIADQVSAAVNEANRQATGLVKFTKGGKRTLQAAFDASAWDQRVAALRGLATEARAQVMTRYHLSSAAIAAVAVLAVNLSPLRNIEAQTEQLDPVVAYAANFLASDDARARHVCSREGLIQAFPELARSKTESVESWKIDLHEDVSTGNLAHWMRFCAALAHPADRSMTFSIGDLALWSRTETVDLAGADISQLRDLMDSAYLTRAELEKVHGMLQYLNERVFSTKLDANVDVTVNRAGFDQLLADLQAVPPLVWTVVSGGSEPASPVPKECDARPVARVFFDHDSAEPVEFKNSDGSDLAKNFRQYVWQESGQGQLLLVGHADGTGHPLHNIDLSWNRSNAVADLLERGDDDQSPPKGLKIMHSQALGTMGWITGSDWHSLVDSEASQRRVDVFVCSGQD